MAVMTVAAGLIVICCGVRTFVSWRNYGDLDNEGGIWTTMAQDASDGMLYRPLVSDLGYGGTRYAPLHALLHARLMKAGIDPVTGGFLLGVAATAFVMGGFYVLLRRLEVPASFAVLTACFFLAPYCVRSGILSIKADLLAAGLDVWGLAAVTFLSGGSIALPGAFPAARPAARWWPAMLLAAVCFVLAAMSKVTIVFGIASAFVWLLMRGEKKKAISLAAVFALGVLLAVLAVQWASDGRAVAVFRACASAAGGWHRLAKAPAGFFPAVFSHDKAVGGFWVTAILLLAARRQWTGLPTILLIFTSVGTLVLFGTRGIDINHLIDLYLASLLLLAVQFRTGRAARIVVPLVMSAMVIHAATSCLREAKQMRVEKRRQVMEAILIDAGKSGLKGPMLAENPMLPILAGDRPYMLDAFMLSVIDLRYPQVDQRLTDDLVHQRFSAVIITADLTHDIRPTPLDHWPTLLQRMKEHYELKMVEDKNLIYLPKAR